MSGLCTIDSNEVVDAFSSLNEMIKEKNGINTCCEQPEWKEKSWEDAKVRTTYRLKESLRASQPMMHHFAVCSNLCENERLEKLGCLRLPFPY